MVTSDPDTSRPVVRLAVVPRNPTEVVKTTFPNQLLIIRPIYFRLRQASLIAWRGGQVFTRSSRGRKETRVWWLCVVGASFQKLFLRILLVQTEYCQGAFESPPLPWRPYKTAPQPTPSFLHNNLYIVTQRCPRVPVPLPVHGVGEQQVALSSRPLPSSASCCQGHPLRMKHIWTGTFYEFFYHSSDYFTERQMHPVKMSKELCNCLRLTQN